MIKPYEKELSLKVERCLIDQALEECSELKRVICQRLKDKTGSDIKEQNSFKVKI